jgi:hypothetical protein
MNEQEIKGKNCAKKADTGDYLSTLMHNGGGDGQSRNTI